MEINNLANQLSYTKSTITPAASVTPQVSRTSAKNMNKKELEVEVNRLRGKKGLYESSLNELRDEIKSLKSTIDELKKEREQYKPSRGLHTTGWLQGQLSLSSFRGQSNEYQEFLGT